MRAIALAALLVSSGAAAQGGTFVGECINGGDCKLRNLKVTGTLSGSTASLKIGGDLKLTDTTTTNQVTCDTSAATATNAIAACTWATSAALGANDLVLEVNRSDGTPLFAVDQEGDFFIPTGILTLSQRIDMVSTGTNTIYSATSPTTTTNAVPAIELRINNNLDANDLVLEVNRADGTQLLGVDYEGDVFLNTTLGGALTGATVAVNSVQKQGAADKMVISGNDANDATAVGVSLTNATTLNTAGGAIATFSPDDGSTVLGRVWIDGSFQQEPDASLPTCGTAAGNSRPGTWHVFDPGGGGRTRFCACTWDGAGTAAADYDWVNLTANNAGTGVGTETTCP